MWDVKNEILSITSEKQRLRLQIYYQSMTIFFFFFQTNSFLINLWIWILERSLLVSRIFFFTYLRIFSSQEFQSRFFNSFFFSRKMQNKYSTYLLLTLIILMEFFTRIFTPLIPNTNHDRKTNNFKKYTSFWLWKFNYFVKLHLRPSVLVSWIFSPFLSEKLDNDNATVLVVPTLSCFSIEKSHVILVDSRRYFWNFSRSSRFPAILMKNPRELRVPLFFLFDRDPLATRIATFRLFSRMTSGKVAHSWRYLWIHRWNNRVWTSSGTREHRSSKKKKKKENINRAN